MADVPLLACPALWIGNRCCSLCSAPDEKLCLNCGDTGLIWTNKLATREAGARSMQLWSKQLQGEEEGHKYLVGDVFSFKDIFYHIVREGKI